MVFNDFILSLQLDPIVFNPFIDNINAFYSNDDDRGDDYILDNDYASPPTEFKTSPDYEVKLSPETDSPNDSLLEEERASSQCYQCVYCQQSSDPYSGSDSYICSRDGCDIKQKCITKDTCHYFSKNEDTYEDY